MFVFDVNSEGTSKDLECYKDAVYHKQWDTNCEFDNATTHIYPNMEKAEYILKTANESNDKDKFVVIDNTPLPAGGTYAGDTIVLEYSCSSNYQMSYNLRATSIYMGIISLIISFAIGSLTYLSIKIHKDIKKKFENNDEDEEEEEYDDDHDEDENAPVNTGLQNEDMNDVDLK
tara:strand:+ start:269 stop:790 length:522 start_codon:yes stop_codon:yes gene_type:complete